METDAHKENLENTYVFTILGTLKLPIRLNIFRIISDTISVIFFALIV